MKDTMKGEKDSILDIMENKGLTSHFQPVRSRDGKVFGYEALARFKENAGFTSIPALFHAAVRTGTIASLDMLCRENAIREASTGLVRENDTHLFINVCPETCLSSEPRGGATDELVDRWGLSRERIILEITEETAIGNYPLLKDAMSFYRDNGYGIAIDDFGIGYGGLKMLSVIRPDYVKVDRLFIQDLDKNFVNLAVVESVAVLCRRLDIKVIAEGIERSEEFTFADSLGIDLFQGYFIGRPSPAGSVFQN
ncbi:MAG: EAL domain-containing protein [Nitrospiraceae bacterium]|nr:EAL domain-containing protein [Nitrospiraceae bacterium]